MYEFKINHIHCGMTAIIFGYDFHDACRRAEKDPELWQIEYAEYID